MKKLSIANMIKFRRKKTDQSKKLFLTNLQKDKEETETEKGGHYWITSLSAVGNAYRHNRLQLVTDKIKELQDKLEKTMRSQTQSMYKQNIGILNNYEDFDLGIWQPAKKLVFHSKPDSILTIKGLQIQASPHHIFSFGKDDDKQIGAIWFVAKRNGYTHDELGMFTDITYRYLKTKFSEKYTINTDYCLAVDVVERFDVNYSQIKNGEIKPILIPTVNEIVKMT